jgi:hypothetical protein
LSNWWIGFWFSDFGCKQRNLRLNRAHVIPDLG